MALRRVGYLLIGLAAVAACGLAGCGGASDHLPREPISGTVTFDGRPLKSGSIQLTPVQTKEGIASGGMVTDGRFDVARADGPVPGQYKVMIFAAGESGAAANAAEPSGPGLAQEKAMAKRTAGLIPLRYNLQTELTAEVTAGGPNTYTFDLKK
jgi:hypothetical protein